jgi:hypothetical protein
MEIPAALTALQSQYKSLLCHFNFGTFDPSNQANNCRQIVERLMADDQDTEWQEGILLVPLDRPDGTSEGDTMTGFEQARVLLRTMWQRISNA